jgi:hypothetical protein
VRWRLEVGLALLLVAVWLAFRLQTGVVLEDALITFRHADNLASGGGYGFNRGEWVQGTTSPLHTLLLAAFSALLGPGATGPAAVALGLGAGAGTALLTRDLLERWGCSPAVQLLIVGGWLLTPRVIWSGVGGMETPLIALFLAWSLQAAERGRGGQMGAALAGLLLTRPEGGLWVGLLALSTWRTPQLWRAALPWAIPVLLWLLAAAAMFGHPVPHSLVAKRLVNPREAPLWSWSSVTSTLGWMSESWRAPLPGLPYVGWALAGAGLALSLWPRYARYRLPAAFLVGLTAAYHLGRAPHFYWYPVPTAWAAALLGAAALGAASAAWARSQPLLWGLGALSLVAGLLQLGPVLREQHEIQENEEQMRAEVGRWLASHTPEGSSVAMEAIGYQGTHSQRRVIDLAGLVSPQVVEIARDTPSNARRLEQILEQEQPAALVLREWEVARDRHFHGGPLFVDDAARQRFLTTWQPAATFRAPHPERMGRNGVVVVWVPKEEL